MADNSKYSSNGQSQAKQMETIQNMGRSEDEKTSSEERKLKICTAESNSIMRRASSGSIAKKSVGEVRDVVSEQPTLRKSNTS